MLKTSCIRAVCEVLTDTATEEMFTKDLFYPGSRFIHVISFFHLRVLVCSHMPITICGSCFEQWTFLAASLFTGGAECGACDEQVDLALNSAAFASERGGCGVQVKIRRA